MEKKFFKTLENETDIGIPVKGDIPQWVNGILIRNGPAKFEQGNIRLVHWFDGYAMLHKFVLKQGKVWYQNRFIHSTNYQTDHANNAISVVATGSVPNPCRSIFGKFFNLFKPVNLDNNNVNIIDFDDKFFAVSDYSTLLEFDIHSLETKGRFKFNDEIGDKFMLSSAHPSVDYHTHQMYNFLCEVGPTVKYYLTCVDMKTGKRSLLQKFTRPYPVVIHSTALTANYYIMIECPSKINFWDLFLGEFRQKPFCEAISWVPEEGTRFYIVDRKTHKMTVIESEAFFFFHTINAFEQDGKICIDLCESKHGNLIRDYYIDKLLVDGIMPENAMKPARYTLDVQKKQVSYQYLTKEYSELPQINKWNYTRPYRYVFLMGLNTTIPNDMYNQLLKMDLETGKEWIWREEGTNPGEPVFIPHPNAKKEDEGVILSVVLDNLGEKSFLLVLDAQSFTEIARAEIPHLIPTGLHGKFFDDANLLTQFEKLQLEKLQKEGFTTRKIYEM